MSWEPQKVKDAVYEALVAATALTDLCPMGVHHRKVVLEPDQVLQYPVVTYQVWGEPIHHGTLGSGRSHSTCTFRVVGWTKDDDRLADSVAVQIEAALHNAVLTAATLSPMTLMLCRMKQSVEGEQNRDTGTHCFAGGVFEIEVSY